jgi:hypothetical protein
MLALFLAFLPVNSYLDENATKALRQVSGEYEKIICFQIFGINKSELALLESGYNNLGMGGLSGIGGNSVLGKISGNLICKVDAKDSRLLFHL